MKTTPIREKIYEFIEMYVDTPEPKKLCSSIEDLVEELAESKVKNLVLSGVSKSVVCGNCDGWGYTVDENGRRKEHCKECE